LHLGDSRLQFMLGKGSRTVSCNRLSPKCKSQPRDALPEYDIDCNRLSPKCKSQLTVLVVLCRCWHRCDLHLGDSRLQSLTVV
jgi:hypothetical protein